MSGERTRERERGDVLVKDVVRANYNSALFALLSALGKRTFA